MCVCACVHMRWGRVHANKFTASNHFTLNKKPDQGGCFSTKTFNLFFSAFTQRVFLHLNTRSMFLIPFCLTEKKQLNLLHSAATLISYPCKFPLCHISHIQHLIQTLSDNYVHVHPRLCVQLPAYSYEGSIVVVEVSYASKGKQAPSYHH